VATAASPTAERQTVWRHPKEFMPSPQMSTGAKFLIAGLLPVAFSAVLTMAAPVPTPFAPYSFTVVLPVMFALEAQPLSEFATRAVAAVYWSLLYAAWTFPTLRSAPSIPLRSILLYSVTGSFSLIWLINGMKYGLQYQGLLHTVLVVTTGTIFIAGIGFLLLLNRKNPSDCKFSAFHILYFVWFGWISFPWLGELI
jgi:hypothetical protein